MRDDLQHCRNKRPRWGFAFPEDFRELDPFTAQKPLQLRLMPVEGQTIDVQTARVMWPWVSDCRRNQRRIRHCELPTRRSFNWRTGVRGLAIGARRRSRRWRRGDRRSEGPHWPVYPQKVERYGIILDGDTSCPFVEIWNYLPDRQSTATF
jgi:hypothetical protein